MLKLCQSTQFSGSSAEEDKRTITVFIAYAPENISDLEKIILLLSALMYQLGSEGEKWQDLKIIVQPYDITTDLGRLTDTAKSDNPLQPYQLIILLLSNEFVGKEFCYSQQMKQIFKDPQVERHLLCILLHICMLKGYPFNALPKSCYLPDNQRPVHTGSGRSMRDKMYQEIAGGIEKAIDDLRIR